MTEDTQESTAGIYIYTQKSTGFRLIFDVGEGEDPVVILEYMLDAVRRHHDRSKETMVA